MIKTLTRSSHCGLKEKRAQNERNDEENYDEIELRHFFSRLVDIMTELREVN